MKRFSPRVIVLLLACASASGYAQERAAVSGFDVCDGSDFLVCLDGAGKLERGEGRPRNRAGAYLMFNWLCENSLEAACTKRSDYDKKEIARELLTASPQWAAGCREGNPTDCYAHALLQQWLSDSSVKAVAQTLERACDGGEMRACSRLAGMFVYGDLPRDDGRALNLYRRSCAILHLGCEKVAEWLAGGGQHEEAQRAAEADCKSHHPIGCEQVGLLRDGARGGPRDAVAAGAAFTLACNLGAAKACVFLGDLQWRGDLGRESRVFSRGSWERSCALGWDDGCLSLAHDDERAGSPASAVKTYRKYCQKGNAAGCDDLGRCIAWRHCPGDKSEVVPALTKACDAKRGAACSRLGSAYAQGFDGDPDPARSYEALKKGCELNDPFGCRDLGAHLRKVGDLNASRTAEDRACALDKRFCRVAPPPTEQK